MVFIFRRHPCTVPRRRFHEVRLFPKVTRDGGLLALNEMRFAACQPARPPATILVGGLEGALEGVGGATGEGMGQPGPMLDPNRRVSGTDPDLT